MGNQLGFYFNADECVGCKACVIACKDIHNLPTGKKFRKVLTGEVGSWDLEKGVAPAGVFSYSISLSCNHCNNPACLAACRKGAIRKDENTGAAVIDEELCVGCGLCIKACPYDAPVRFKDQKKTYKCDMCLERLAEGREPACVATCMMRCLQVAPIDELRQNHSDLKVRGFATNALLSDESITKPNIVVVPHRFDTGLRAEEVTLTSMPEEYLNYESNEEDFSDVSFCVSANS